VLELLLPAPVIAASFEENHALIDDSLSAGADDAGSDPALVVAGLSDAGRDPRMSFRYQQR
jgi:hypothetical protein